MHYLKSIDNVKIISFFICTIPFFLLTGSFLSDLSLSLAALIFFVVSFQKDNTKYFFNYFVLFFLIFYIYIVFSSILSEYPDFSLRSSLLYFRYGLFSLAVWYVIDNNPKFPKYFIIILSLSFIYAILDGYSQFYFDSHLINFSTVHSDRLSLPLNQKLVLGAYISRLFPLLLALFIFLIPSSRSMYVVLGALLIVTDVLVYLSGERTALGLMLISTIFILIFLSKFKLLRIATLCTSLIFIVLISAFSPEIKQRNIDYTITQLGLNEGSEKFNLLSPQHESHIKSAWLIFKDHKFFGAGPNTFRKYCGKEEYNINHLSCSTHPHNIYIQHLSEIGLVGIIIFFIPILYLFRKIIIHIYQIINEDYGKLSDYQICIIACFLVTLFPLLPSLSFYNNWINVIYYLPVGFFLHSIFRR
tara:strand:- start:985 stop:2232 length:1248 start_codon:yes stop_codon:yes gene_type:complete